MKHIYTSIDIGSDSIKIVVCELYQNKLNLLSASSYKSQGIKKGLITDVEAASTSVKQAFTEVEMMLGIKIKKVIASVPSYFSDYSVVKGACEVKGENNIIDHDDVMNSLQDAITTKQSMTKEMVTILPVDYKIDDQEGIKNPFGQRGKILHSRAVLVSTPKKNIYSVISLLNGIGIEVVDISLNNIGDLYAFKNKDIDHKIGAIINIGSENTSISLYNRGVIVKSSIINMGGKNIDSDIAYIYKTDTLTANKLKQRFALAHKRNANVGDTYEIKTSYDEMIKINQFEISEVVSSRIEEILNLAKKEINVLTSKRIDYIIITGGTSNIADIEYIANDCFGKNVSIGNIKLLGIRNNKYSSCIGNIVYFISKLKLKGKNYSMVDAEEAEEIATVKRSSIESSSDTMLGKIFGYFFNE